VIVLWSNDHQSAAGDALSPGATPATIRGALLTAEHDAFDMAYRRALTAARDDLDLAELFRCLEHWRGVALRHRDTEQQFASVGPRARSDHESADDSAWWLG
jgi:hypothetical protein